MTVIEDELGFEIKPIPRWIKTTGYFLGIAWMLQIPGFLLGLAFCASLPLTAAGATHTTSPT